MGLTACLALVSINLFWQRSGLPMERLQNIQLTKLDIPVGNIASKNLKFI